MSKKNWLWDIFLGALLTGIVALGYKIPKSIPLLREIELKSYDWRSQLRQTLDSGRQIAIIAVDNNSISQFGRWPWPRSRMAELLDKLKDSHPRVVGLDFVYSEPERNRGLKEIESLGSDYQKLVSSHKIREKRGLFESFFSSAAVRLDSDARLLNAIKESGNVVLPIVFMEEGFNRPNPPPLPLLFSSSSVRIAIRPRIKNPIIPAGFDAAYPIVSFAAAAAGIGQANLKADFDGVLRSVAPIMRYGNIYLPAYSLALVLEYLKINPATVIFSPAQGVSIGKSEIPLDGKSRMMITFNGPYRTFRYYSFRDVIDGRVDSGAFKDKIVIIGPTATGIATLDHTPLSSDLPPIEVIANITENILDSRFITRPPWVIRLDWSLLAIVSLFILFALPLLPAFWGFILSLLIFIFLIGIGSYFFVLGQWVRVTYPAALLGMGYLFGITRRFFVAEKGKERIEASAIETNKMLGLSFQGQGMLDLAFEKFKLCPLDDGMKETLHHLSLDFERKRQFAKAASVLELIFKKDRKYKEIATKIDFLKSAAG